jgi:hypothetical protein
MGFRVSKNQGPWPPSPNAQNVFVFGGSTTFCYGLPDHQTVASFLQEELAARLPQQVNVYNFACGSYQSTQERILFQELLVKGFRPDLAIFIDGLNDFAFAHVPAYTAELEQLFRLRNSPGRPETLFLWISKWPMMLFARAHGFRIGNPRINADAGENLDSIVRRYLANLRESAAIARDFGVQAAFVWQPIPFYQYDLQYHPFADDPFLNRINRHARAGYQRMKEVAEAHEPGPNFLWCADMQQSARKPMYVDGVHYNAEFSRQFARHIVTLLLAHAGASGA